MVTTQVVKTMARRALGWIAAAVGIAAAAPAADSTITYYHNDIAGSPVAATNAAAKAAEPARKILAEHGIDINSAENGAAMSKGRHRRTHTNEYYQGLNESLTEANQGEKAADNVRGVLSDYREHLEKP